jgi:hypothetical protein
MNKKSTIDISLRTILGLVLAIIVLVVILYFIKDILAIFLPGPSAVTMANFNRLGDEISNLGYGDEIIVPYFMASEDSMKLVSYNIEPTSNCYPKNCLCICRDEANGCDKFGERRICFKGYEVVIENPDKLKIENYKNRINLLSIRKEAGIDKEPGKIIIKDTALACSSGNVCCRTVDTTGDIQTVVNSWSTEKECEGYVVPCSSCPQA